MESTRADTTALPHRVAEKPSEALPLVEQRLADAYNETVAEVVLEQLVAWDDMGYYNEYTAVLWDVAADITGQPIADDDDLRMGVEAWRADGTVYQQSQEPTKRTDQVEHPKVVRSAVEDVIALSQRTARERVGEYVTVYRGVFDDVWEQYVTQTSDGARVDDPAAMEAWTLNRDFAERHGDHTMRMTISTDTVLFFGELFQERQHYRMKELTLGHNQYVADVADPIF